MVMSARPFKKSTILTGSKKLKLIGASCLPDEIDRMDSRPARCSTLIFLVLLRKYRAQVLKDEKGNRFIAPFPEGVTKAVQYGTGLKAHSVYMSQFQLIPHNRIQGNFSDQLHIPISEGAIFNFNKEAFQLLNVFEKKVKHRLTTSELAHAEETGINIGGDRHWLHCVSNDFWTLYSTHEKGEWMQLMI